jgi:integrase/recombinase XerD
MIHAQLTPLITGFLETRRCLGFGVRTQERMLRSYVEWATRDGADQITAQGAVEWACSASAAPNGQAARLGVVRRFLTYVSAYDAEVAIPPRGLLVGTRRRRPFLFSAIQLGSLMERASALGPDGSLRPHTISALFGLLASTGLRPSEALKLTVADVRLDGSPQLNVRDTKFHKSRLVPIHSTTAARLSAYAERRGRLRYDRFTDAFFVSEQHRPVHYMAVYRTFQRLLDELGIRAQTTERAPSLNSFRHGFAVDRLCSWAREGADVQTWMPHLAVYMGHVDLTDTYWYFTATPALLETASEAFGSYFQPGGAQ